MSDDVYLFAVDSKGTVVTGAATLSRPLADPFRDGVSSDRPVLLSSYRFDADLPTSTGAGGTEIGKFVPGEIAVELVEDVNTALFFRSCYRGTAFRSVDVLVATSGESGVRVLFGVGVSNAIVSSLGFSGSTGAEPRRTMTFTGKVFVVGSAVQKTDGSFTPFLTSSYDVTRGSGN